MIVPGDRRCIFVDAQNNEAVFERGSVQCRFYGPLSHAARTNSYAQFFTALMVGLFERMCSNTFWSTIIFKDTA